MLPGVSISILNGQLGRTPGSADGVAGMIGTGAATGSLTLGQAYQLFSVADAEDLGINEAYDTTNSTKVWRHIKDFYAQATEGAELWIMVVSPTTTLADMANSAGNFAPVLLDAAGGRITLLGLSRNPSAGYLPVYTDGIDTDIKDGVLAAQTLATAYANKFAPIRVLVECRDFQGDVGLTYNFRQGTQNRVGVVLMGVAAGSKAAAVGLALGRLAAMPVQRNIGRVKSGDLNLSAAYLSDGNKIEAYSHGQLAALHDKGYIIPRTFPGLSGYYFADDPAATLITDDYSSLARGRVIDKAIRLAYITYVNEINDDLDIDPETGYLNPAVAKSYQARIETVLQTEMVSKGEASGVSAFVDPRQNVLANDQVAIRLAVVPKGYAKQIVVELGFSNPQNNA